MPINLREKTIQSRISRGLSREQAESIWFDTDTKKYHFIKESEEVDGTPYGTIEECLDALKQYCLDLELPLF